MEEETTTIEVWKKDAKYLNDLIQKLRFRGQKDLIKDIIRVIKKHKLTKELGVSGNVYY